MGDHQPHFNFRTPSSPGDRGARERIFVRGETKPTNHVDILPKREPSIPSRFAAILSDEPEDAARGNGISVRPTSPPSPAEDAAGKDGSEAVHGR